MKPLHLVMGVSLLVSAWFAIFGDKTPDGDVAEVPSRVSNEGRNTPQNTSQNTQPTNQTARAGSNDAARTVILPLRPRAELISEEKTAARGNLFGHQGWVAPVVASIDAAAQPAAPVVPPLTYVGKKQEDGIWEVYLAQQDQIFIVKDKTVIEGKYRVESIAPPKLVLTYLPLSQKQTVMIGDAQ